MFRPLEVAKKSLLRSCSIKDVDRPVVFFGGRFTTQKGVDTLLKAAEIYCKTNEKPIKFLSLALAI